MRYTHHVHVGSAGSRVIVIGLFAAVLTGALGCAGAPRERPVKAGPVATGPDTLEAVRRQIEGTWDLVSLQVLTPDGQTVTRPAGGRLTYDAYGNMSMEGSGENAQLIAFKGRAVIDPVRREIRLADLEGSGALPSQASADKVRHYEFDGPLLKTSVRDASGRVTAVVTWRRSQ
jgi:uncharacterized protein RhaS with RHS repeats